MNAIANLVPYYFKFRYYKEGVRKSDCPEKVLFKFTEDEAELGYRLTNEGDYRRVRPIVVDEELIALHHLDRAYNKLSGTTIAPRLQQIINDVHSRVTERAKKTYVPDPDVW